MVQLTPELVQALHLAHGKPLAVVDPGSHETYYIVTERDHELLKELEDEEQAVAAFTKASLRNAIARLEEEP